MKKRRWNGRVSACVLALLLVLASTASCSPAATPRSAPTATRGPACQPGTVCISIMTTDTKAEWLGKATEFFNNAEIKTAQGHPIYVEMLQESTPGDAQQGIQNGAFQPTIWSPGEMSPVDLANQYLKLLGIPPLRWLIEPSGIFEAIGAASGASQVPLIPGPALALVAIAIFTIWQTRSSCPAGRKALATRSWRLAWAPGRSFLARSKAPRLARYSAFFGSRSTAFWKARWASSPCRKRTKNAV